MRDFILQNAANTLRSPEFSAFANALRAAFAKNFRVNITGIGTAGRIGIRLERVWRKIVCDLMEKYPQTVPTLENRLPYFRHVDLVGECDVLGTPELLAQSNIYGRGVMRAAGVASARRDFVVCLDPTADTPSTLGSCHFSLIHLAETYCITCVKPDPEKSKYAREVFTHPYCKVLTVADPMVMEILCAVALEAALWDLLEVSGLPNEFPGFDWFADHLTALQLQDTPAYTGNLLCADEYLLEALCFAAEHPRFKAMNPAFETAEAWERCFLQQPPCLGWPADFYQGLGFSNDQIRCIPDNSAEALLRTPIGKEALPSQDGLMLDAIVEKYTLPQTHMEIFQRLVANLHLKALSR